MPTTFTTLWRLAVIAPGDPAVKNSWGAIQDLTMPLMEQGAVGTISVAIGGLATFTLTTANNATDQARYLKQTYTGALLGACTVTIPNVARVGWAQNLTTGGFNVILSAGGTTATIPPDGAWYFWASDGATNVGLPTIGLTNLSTSGNLTVTGTAAITGHFTLAANFDLTLDVTGQFTSHGALLAASSLQVNGVSTLNGLLTLNAGSLFNGTITTGAGIGINAHGPITTDTGTTLTFTGGFGYTSTGVAAAPGPFSLGYGISAGGQNMAAANFFAGSDGRLKIDVQTITEAEALRWARGSRPVRYRKRPRYDSSDDEAVPEAGFIAQEQIKAGFADFVAPAPSPGMPPLLDEDGFQLPADVMMSLPLNYQVAMLTRTVQYLLSRLGMRETYPAA